MPRDGSDVYSIPPGTHGIEDTTIESARYNAFVDDVAQDLNTARPILSGGTGATNATDALTELGAEHALQLVTNYDLDPLYPGSFYSMPTATGGPIDNHAFVGICYVIDGNNGALEARDQTDTSVPGRKYVREKKGGVWSAWYIDGASSFVSINGPTSMTGPLTIDPVSGNATLILSGDVGANDEIYGYKAGLARWVLRLGDASPETGANAGSDFGIASYKDDGSPLDVPFVISRATGLATVKDVPTAPLGIATKGYVDAQDAAEVTRANTAYQAKDAQLFAGIPINPQTTYTCLLTDAQKCIQGTGTVTIPANASVAFPIGTCISFCAFGGSMTVACGDTMYFNKSGAVTTGPRVITNVGIATALKVNATNWVISGNGIT